MKCSCGNDIQIKMGSQLVSKGCKILTAITVVVTAQCDECGAMFQVPIKSNSSVVRKGK